MNVLFITHTRIGDAVMSSGLLHHLVETYPTAQFTIACGPLAAPLFKHTPRLARIIEVRKRPFDLHWYRLWKELRGTVWDIAVDLRRSMVTYIIPVRKRHVIGPIAPGEHQITHLNAFLSLPQSTSPFLYVTDNHRALARALIPDGAPVLALAPVAATAPKTWPAEKFAELAQRLTAPGERCAGWRVALFGGPQDATHVKPILQAVPDAVSIFDQPDLLTVQGALARCRSFIGNDSGLAHLAASAGVPALSLFGPTDPRRYGPWGGVTLQTADDISTLPVDDVIRAYDHHARLGRFPA